MYHIAESYKHGVRDPRKMIDWNDAFDNSGYVMGSDSLAKRWSAAAATFRDKMLDRGLAQLNLAYDAGARNRLDLFWPDGECAGIVVFIHGGYWHMLDKDYWSHLAQAAVTTGLAVAIPSYTLAPEARVTEIAREVCEAIRFAAENVDGPIRLIGHSAGGHLVTRMLCADSCLPGEIRRRLSNVVAVSGVFDLRPLLLTRMNEILHLSEQEATAESPALHAPLPNINLSCWVGAGERPEFLRQTRLITELWQSTDNSVTDHYEPGKNHFSVIEGLASPASELFEELMR